LYSASWACVAPDSRSFQRSGRAVRTTPQGTTDAHLKAIQSRVQAVERDLRKDEIAPKHG